MDRRMAAYGNQVLSTNSSARAWSHPPLRPRENYSALNDKISDLSYDITNRKKKQQEAEIISNLSTIVSKLNSPVKQYNDPYGSPNPSFHQHPSYSPPVQDMSPILSAFQRQQEIMLNLIQNISSPPKPSSSKKIKYYKKKKSRRSKKNPNSSSSSDSEYDIRVRPDNVKQVLAELNFNDDGAEEYADKEQKLKFDVNLPEEEKYKIIMQIQKDNNRKFIENNTKLKGIKRFRKIAIVVYFPIVLVSNMLEKKSRFYSELSGNMENHFNTYLEVGQKWMFRVMKTTLASIISDPNLDLTLTNNPNEIKNQTINTRIIKLQVRINGILEGLETYTNEKDVPDPFKGFVNKITQNKSYIPDAYLTSFEESRLEFNEFGGLMNMNEDRKKMLICFFFITRIMVKTICLKPGEAGIPVSRTSKVSE